MESFFHIDPKGLKVLQEESDALLAMSMGLSEGVQALENDQRSHFLCVDEELESEENTVAQAQASLSRLNEILAIKKDPDWQFTLPPVTFTLDNFSERKISEETWYSPYFYSHEYGYKMQLRVFPNGTGEGKGTHVSIFVVIVPGEFDDLLTWPFCGIVTLHLINQRKNGLNVTHKVHFTTVENVHCRDKPQEDIKVDVVAPSEQPVEEAVPSEKVEDKFKESSVDPYPQA